MENCPRHFLLASDGTQMPNQIIHYPFSFFNLNGDGYSDYVEIAGMAVGLFFIFGFNFHRKKDKIIFGFYRSPSPST